MRLWPHHTFALETPLSKQAAREALAACTGPERRFAPIGLPDSRNDLRFYGSIDGDRFEIRRVMGYTNLFAPRTSGVIEPTERGARITVTMDGRGNFAFTMGIWSAFVLIVFFTVMLPALIIFILPGYIVGISMYAFEADLQRRSLRRIFHAR